MSAALPVISGRDAIKAFEKLGYVVVRQRGSHVRLIHEGDPVRAPLSIPIHRELDAGLLRSLVRLSGLSPQEFGDLL